MTETIEEQSVQQFAYTPTNWVDDVTPVNAANLNKIEAQLASLDARTNSMELYVSGTGSDSADGLPGVTVGYSACCSGESAGPPVPGA